MNRLALMALAGLLVAAGGCDTTQYRSQPLGQVDYDKAFAVSKEVFSEYFSIESASAKTGKIVGRPKSIEGAPDRLLGRSPARQIATMRVRRKDDLVFADIRVEIQRQGSIAAQQMQPVTVDTDYPGRTPAQEDAPLTMKQRDTWQMSGRDDAVESKILADLLGRLAAP